MGAQSRSASVKSPRSVISHRYAANPTSSQPCSRFPDTETNQLRAWRHGYAAEFVSGPNGSRGSAARKAVNALQSASDVGSTSDRERDRLRGSTKRRATRASRSCLLPHAAEIALFLPYLPDIAVPFATRSIAGRPGLPRSLWARRSDRLRDRCKVVPAVPSTLRDSTRVLSNSLRGSKDSHCLHRNGPAATTRTHSPPPERP